MPVTMSELKQKKKEYRHLEHEFGPLYDANSRVLILGSFPSVKSREQQFYYGHPQNRFWKIMARVLGQGDQIPVSIEEKKKLMHGGHIALWDVIESCDIIGSSDSSIRNAKVNDLSMILPETKICRIYVNGSTAYRIFEKYMRAQIEGTGLKAIRLPSTSPANAAWSFDRLLGEWKQIGEELS